MDKVVCALIELGQRHETLWKVFVWIEQSHKGVTEGMREREKKGDIGLREQVSVK